MRLSSEQHKTNLLTCVGERRAAVLHELLAGRIACPRSAALILAGHACRTPYTAGPVTTVHDKMENELI